MKGILLFIIAFLLAIILMPFGMLYSTIRFWVKANFKEWWKEMGLYFKSIALSIDQTGNVVCATLFNDLLITKEGYQFGKEDETISSVLGKNQELGTLKGIGKGLNWILHKLDPNHSINSIEHDE